MFFLSNMDYYKHADLNIFKHVFECMCFCWVYNWVLIAGS